MNCSPTLTAQEFSDLHNANCELRGILQSMEGVVNEKLKDRFEKALEQINKALENAYAQDDAAFNKNSLHYDAISAKHGFKSIWSVHEVSDLNTPFAGTATHLLYKDHWGEFEVLVPINGNTWVDLWSAAEEAIKKSTDDHHIFIEAFISGDDGILVLSTGS